MVRAFLVIGALIFVPAIGSAQQPCTTDARHVVDEIYRHMLERSADQGSQGFVDRLASGKATVRDIVRDVATSAEHNQRFGQESPDRNVATIYRHLLGRQADAGGNAAYAQMAAQRGMAAVIEDILNSAEYQQQFGAYGVPGSGGLRFCGSGAQTTSVAPAPTYNNNNNNAGSRADMRFRGMDANGDGIIQRNEWRGNAQAFDTRDWNHDNMLSGDEVRVGRGSGSSAANNVDYTLDDRFDYLDVNGDGRVTMNEWDGAPNAFERLDRNRDGRLTRAELGLQGTMNFAALDTNNNGNISLDEWRWSRDSFESMDTDHNGVVTQREYRGGTVGTSGR